MLFHFFKQGQGRKNGDCFTVFAAAHAATMASNLAWLKWKFKKSVGIASIQCAFISAKTFILTMMHHHGQPYFWVDSSKIPTQIDTGG